MLRPLAGTDCVVPRPRRGLPLRVALLLAFLAITLAPADAALAATRTWDGDGPDGNWSTGANWVGGVAPQDGDELVFPAGASRLTTNNDLSATTRLVQIVFSGGGYIVGGSAIHVTGPLRTTHATGITEISAPITLDADSTLEAGAFGRLTLLGTIATNGHALTLKNDDDTGGGFDVDGRITGSGAVTVDGNVILNGDNTYTGVTTVSSGTLSITSSSALGAATSGTSVADGATLAILGGGLTVPEPLSLSGLGVGGFGALRNQNANTLSGRISLNGATTRIDTSPFDTTTLTLSGVVQGTGALDVIGIGTLVLDGSAPNVYEGATTVFEGRLVAAKTGALGASVAGQGTTVQSGATVEIRDGATIADPLTLFGQGVGGTGALVGGADGGTWSGPISLNNANTRINVTSGETLMLSGVVSGPGGLFKMGAGTLALGGTGANSYLGSTTVDDGTLAVAKGGALGAASAGTTVRTGHDLAIDGSFTNDEPLELEDRVSVALLSGTSTWTATVTLVSATTRITVEEGSRLTLSGSIEGIGKIDKAGLGTLRLAGGASNTYTSSTTVFEGVLELSKTGGQTAIPGALVIGDGAGGPDSDVVRLLAINQIANTAEVVIRSSGLLDLFDHGDTIGLLVLIGGHVVTDDVNSVGIGTLNLNDDVLVVGSPVQAVIAGRLALGSTTRNFTVQNGTATTDLRIAATIVNGALTKNGLGTMALGSGVSVGESNAYTGDTRINEGILSIDVSQPASRVVLAGGTLVGFGVTGPVTSGTGVIAPGVVGTDGISSTTGILGTRGLALNAEANVKLNLTGGGPFSPNDQIGVVGTVDLGGSGLTLIGTVSLNPGNVLRLIDNDGNDPIVGTFAGFPEGQVLSDFGSLMRITYQGGTGNDVELVGADRCHIRPPVRLEVTPDGPGRLRVVVRTARNVTIPVNGLIELRFQAGTNALVDVDGQNGRSGAFTVPIAGGPTSTTFFVRRQQAGATHLPFLVIDGCGAWPTFVGGGPNAF